MLTGMFIQMYNGYYNVEPLQYIKELFGFKLISLSLICILAMAVQVIVNNKYIGYFVAVLIVILLPVAFSLLEWNNQLFLFNSGGPRLPYSDMNGYGHSIYPFTIFKIYWSSFAMILIVLSNLLWVRGKKKGFKTRLNIAKPLFTGKARLTISLAFLVFLLAGGFIYYNTHILNKFTSPKKQEIEQANFEKKYKRYSKTPQPRIVSVNWNVDIFPQERGVRISGFYILKNKSNKPVDSILVNLYPEISLKELKFGKSASLLLEDKDNGFRIYKLATPLQYGDSIQLNINLDYFPKGFKNSNPETAIVYNGTFFNNQLLPG